MFVYCLCYSKVYQSEVIGRINGIENIIYLHTHSCLNIAYREMLWYNLKSRRSVELALEGVVQLFDIFTCYLFVQLLIHSFRKACADKTRRYGEQRDTEQTNNTGNKATCKGNRWGVGKASGVADILCKCP